MDVPSSDVRSSWLAPKPPRRMRCSTLDWSRAMTYRAARDGGHPSAAALPRGPCSRRKIRLFRENGAPPTMAARKRPSAARTARRRNAKARPGRTATARSRTGTMEPEAASGVAPGMQTVNTYLAVANVNASMEFLERAFAFSRGVVLPDHDGQVRYAEMRHGDSVIMLVRRGDPATASGGAAALYTYAVSYTHLTLPTSDLV